MPAFLTMYPPEMVSFYYSQIQVTHLKFICVLPTNYLSLSLSLSPSKAFSQNVLGSAVVGERFAKISFALNR